MFLKMAAATAKYYFRFRMCWCHCLQKVEVYQQTKFRRDISIGGWDITTSGFEIQTSAILEFYFRFRSRPVRRNLYVFLHQAAKFRPNRITTAEIWRHIHFSRWRQRPLNTTSGFVCVDVTAFRRSKSISKPNFVDISPLAAGLRYNYFRFRNTNVRHIGILLLISISTSSLYSTCYSASGYRIPSISEHPLRKYDVISVSQDGGRDR